MPSQKQDFSFPAQTAEELLLTAYGTFLALGWTPKYAGPAAIVGYTPRSWSKYDDEILVEAADGTLTVSSSMVHNEAFDMLGKNKKHIKDFITAFEKVKAGGIRSEWAGAVEQLRQQTVVTVKQETKNSEELDNVMKMSGGNRYVTYGIIGINVLVFIAMVFNGVNFFSPTSIDILNWGANYEPLTVTGDWWRLITSTFVHIGIIHLAFNMYALYMAGVFLEPMLGKIRYIIAYLCSGILASIGSLVWHDEPVPSAGASGAIFGIYGVFLALLLTNLIPKQMRMSLLQSIGIFVVFNLVYGMRSGIDNAAHIGGLISGMIIGFVYYFSLKKGEDKKGGLAAIVIALATILVTWFYLDNASMSVSTETRQQTQNEIKEASAKDGTRYFDMFGKFSEIDKKCVAIINDTTTGERELLNNVNNLMPEWNKAAAIVEEMKKLNLSDLSKRKIELLEEYTNARKEEVTAYAAYLTEKKPGNALRLAEARERITTALDEMNELK
jgi:rhomboid protease GluP